jgi:hypothetical protein
MHTWLIIVTVVAVVVLVLVLRAAKRPRAGGLESPRIEAGEHRDELARNAGVASFGLNLPWRRARRGSGR